MSTPPPGQSLDCWEAGLTREQQENRLHAAVARIMENARAIEAGEKPRPVTSWAELNVDGDTRIRGGLSRSARKHERRPHRPIHRDGYVSENGGRSWAAEVEG